MRTVRLAALALAGMLGVGMLAPSAAEAGSKGKRNTALVLGAVGVYGIVKKQPLVAGLGLAGAGYSYASSLRDRDRERRRDRWRRNRGGYYGGGYGPRYYRSGYGGGYGSRYYRTSSYGGYGRGYRRGGSRGRRCY